MKYTAIIDKKFSEGLSAHEEQTLKNILKTNKEALSYFETVKMSHDVIRSHGRSNLRDRLKTIEQANTLPKSKKTAIKIIFIAALLILGYFMLNLFSKSNQNPNIKQNANLYAMHFTDYPIRTKNRNNSTSGNLENSEIVKNYVLNNYKLVLQQIDKPKQVSDLSESEQFFLKISSLMNLDLHKKAQDELTAYLSRTNKEIETAQWYLALSYLKENEVELAKKHLEKLSSCGKIDLEKKSKSILLQLK